MEFTLSLMDVNEKIKMLEEYRDALQARLEKVNKRDRPKLSSLRDGVKIGLFLCKRRFR